MKIWNSRQIWLWFWHNIRDLGSRSRQEGNLGIVSSSCLVISTVAAFRRMHVSPANSSMRDYQESVTAGQTDTQTDRVTDAWQSDPYVPLCFAGNTKIYINCVPIRHNYRLRIAVIDSKSLQVAWAESFSPPPPLLTHRAPLLCMYRIYPFTVAPIARSLYTVRLVSLSMRFSLILVALFTNMCLT